MFPTDEPTSGLQSQMAWSACKLLRKLVNNGQAILCAMHQPSTLLFDMFGGQFLLPRHDGKPLIFLGRHRV